MIKTLRILCIGHQGVLVKKPFSEALATLLVIAKLTCDGIATRKDSVQIFMLRREDPLPERVISLTKKDEGVKAYAVDEYEICLVCKGRAMIDLLSGMVAETGEIQHVVMKDAPKKQSETPTTPSNPTNPTNPTTPSTPTTETAKETPTTPKTGDDRSPLIWLLLLGLGGGMAGAAWFLRKKGKEEQNQD